ncbi:hypothetical protein Bca52824_024258 [Brassica carinata]|uniref:Uncharacterized protein n=1 Tax=Brassica carinata TaxID=52824 RepID=A0A8X7VK30_BRACI|nr:hypothetical protein Bca52824_024258 [Brassica carinata]
MGRLRLMPRMLTLSAVQRQAAASRSAKPSISEQHGATGGYPNIMLTTSRALAQRPICRLSLVQVP